MDSALSAGGRGPFRGQDAPCARLKYCIRIQRVRVTVSEAKAQILLVLNAALKGRSSTAWLASMRQLRS